MALVRLVRMTALERAAFADAQVVDCAAWLLERAEAATPATARARAASEIESELAAAVGSGDLLWTAARQDEGPTVGWLWVKRGAPGLPSDAAFLYQIQVVVAVRRQGYGRAMLSALEDALAALGFGELRLNVWDTNAAARQLYAAAGDEQVEQLAVNGSFGKVLSPPTAELRP